MIKSLTVKVHVPEGATHYESTGTGISFYKRQYIGVAGVHWFVYDEDFYRWVFRSHSDPYNVEEIPND